MKLLSTINNRDFKSKKSLKDVFESTSISKNRCNVQCTYNVDILDNKNNIVKVSGKLKFIGADDSLISKAVVYFPERKYGIEFINTNNEYTIEFLFDVVEKNEYFNMVLYDNENLVISSMTYVFNKFNIVQYPIIAENISHINANSHVDVIDDEVVFTTEINDNKYSGMELKHIWQNLGQHMIKEPSLLSGENNKVRTKEKLSNMCKGIWMLISIDQSNNLINQLVVDI